MSILNKKNPNTSDHNYNIKSLYQKHLIIEGVDINSCVCICKNESAIVNIVNK